MYFDQPINILAINIILQFLLGPCRSAASNQVKEWKERTKKLKPIQKAKKMKPNSKKSQNCKMSRIWRIIPVKNVCRWGKMFGRIKPKQRIKPNQNIKQNIKLKSLPMSYLLLKEKVQVSRRLAERDQFQHNQLGNYRGGKTCVLSR